MNELKEFEDAASKIVRQNINNYKYEYWIKTPNGMRKNEVFNHKYGDTRTGFDKWRESNRNLSVGYGGQVSIRTMFDTSKEGQIVGYVTEERLSDTIWHSDLETVVEDCFEKLCTLIDVTDKDCFRSFIFANEGLYKDYKSLLDFRLTTLIEVNEKYNSDNKYKKLIDKIKR